MGEGVVVDAPAGLELNPDFKWALFNWYRDQTTEVKMPDGSWKRLADLAELDFVAKGPDGSPVLRRRPPEG